MAEKYACMRCGGLRSDRSCVCRETGSAHQSGGGDGADHSDGGRHRVGEEHRAAPVHRGLAKYRGVAKYRAVDDEWPDTSARGVLLPAAPRRSVEPPPDPGGWGPTELRRDDRTRPARRALAAGCALLGLAVCLALLDVRAKIFPPSSTGNEYLNDGAIVVSPGGQSSTTWLIKTSGVPSTLGVPSPPVPTSRTLASAIAKPAPKVSPTAGRTVAAPVPTQTPAPSPSPTASPTALPDVTGTITGVGGLCVDDRYSGQFNGSVVQIWVCNATAAQLWTLRPDGTIRAFGMCMSSTAAGGVVLWACNGGDAERWRLGSASALVNAATGMCLDDRNMSTSVGTDLRIFACHGGSSQRWTVG